MQIYILKSCLFPICKTLFIAGFNIKNQSNASKNSILQEESSCPFQFNEEQEIKIICFQKKLKLIKDHIQKILQQNIKQIIDIQKFMKDPKGLDDVLKELNNGEFILKLQIPIENCELLNFHNYFMLFLLSTKYIYGNDSELSLILLELIWQIMKPYMKKDLVYKQICKKYKHFMIQFFKKLSIQNYENIMKDYQDYQLVQLINEEFDRIQLFKEVKQIEHLFPYLIINQYRKFIKNYLIQLKNQLSYLYDIKFDETIYYLIRKEYSNFINQDNYFKIERLNQLEATINKTINFTKENTKLDNIQDCFYELVIKIQQYKKSYGTDQNLQKFKLHSSYSIFKPMHEKIIDIIYLFLLGSGLNINQNKQKTIEKKKEYYSNMRVAIKIIINYLQNVNYQGFQILKLCENIAQELLFKSNGLNLRQLNNKNKHYKFKLISDSNKISKTITICISGLLNEKEDGQQSWKALDQFDDSIVLYLSWPSSYQSKFVVDLVTTILNLTKQIQQDQKNELNYQENKDQKTKKIKDLQDIFNQKKNEAQSVGQFLSNIIQQNYFQGYILNFVGHSLGVEVIHSMFKHLDQIFKSQVKIIYNVLFMGGAVDIQSLAQNKYNCLTGEIINVYSKNDLVLKYLYKGCRINELPCGRSKIPYIYRKIRNCNLSSKIEGHSRYYYHLSYILKQIDFNNDIRKTYHYVEDQISEQNINQLFNQLL